MSLELNGVHVCTHIVIKNLGPLGARKTNTYSVHSNYGGDELGSIRWFGRWRKYAFFPCHETVYEEVCMRELSDFIVAETKARRIASRPAPPVPKGCNRHTDCSKRPEGSECCHDEGCGDCFGQ
jgi:hypothetical protein